MIETKPLIFDATGGSDIYRRLVQSGRYEEGRLLRKVYGDGEIGHFIQPDLAPGGAHPSLKGTLRGREVVIVGDLSTNELVIDTYDVCNVAFDETARKLTLVVPEASLRKDKFRRRALLDLLASVPSTPAGNRLVLADGDFVGTPEYTSVKPMKRSANNRHKDTAFDLFGNNSKPVLLYTSSYEYLAREMTALGDYELGECEWEQLDGKPFFKKLKTKVLGRRVIIVSGAIDARETIEQYYMARAVALEGALAREVIESYMANATMERKTKSGEAVKAKIRARLLSCLPACPLDNRIIFVDLHSEGIPYYLEGGLQPHHVYVGKHLVAAVARDMCGQPSTNLLGTVELEVPACAARDLLTLCATDNGRSKWVDSMGLDTHLATAFGRKERVGDDQIVFLGALGYVLGHNALIYDDKCGTGGTAIKAASGIRIDQYGPAFFDEVRQETVSGGSTLVAKTPKTNIDPATIPDVTSVACFSHLVGRVAQKLLDARDALGRPVFKSIVAANTHPAAQALANGTTVIVKSIAPLLVKALD
jgi:ribose-phosphate pyrophosphokinase